MEQLAVALSRSTHDPSIKGLIEISRVSEILRETGNKEALLRIASVVDGKSEDGELLERKANMFLSKLTEAIVKIFTHAGMSISGNIADALSHPSFIEYTDSLSDGLILEQLINYPDPAELLKGPREIIERARDSLRYTYGSQKLESIMASNASEKSVVGSDMALSLTRSASTIVDRKVAQATLDVFVDAGTAPVAHASTTHDTYNGVRTQTTHRSVITGPRTVINDVHIGDEIEMQYASAIRAHIRSSTDPKIATARFAIVSSDTEGAGGQAGSVQFAANPALRGVKNVLIKGDIADDDINGLFGPPALVSTYSALSSGWVGEDTDPSKALGLTRNESALIPLSGLEDLGNTFGTRSVAKKLEASGSVRKRFNVSVHTTNTVKLGQRVVVGTLAQAGDANSNANVANTTSTVVAIDIGGAGGTHTITLRSEDSALDLANNPINANIGAAATTNLTTVTVLTLANSTAVIARVTAHPVNAFVASLATNRPQFGMGSDLTFGADTLDGEIPVRFLVDIASNLLTGTKFTVVIFDVAIMLERTTPDPTGQVLDATIEFTNEVYVETKLNAGFIAGIAGSALFTPAVRALRGEWNGNMAVDYARSYDEFRKSRGHKEVGRQAFRTALSYSARNNSQVIDSAFKTGFAQTHNAGLVLNNTTGLVNAINSGSLDMYMRPYSATTWIGPDMAPTTTKLLDHVAKKPLYSRWLRLLDMVALLGIMDPNFR
jgi:hypothetical protein